MLIIKSFFRKNVMVVARFLKGPEFAIDHSISSGYLLRLSLTFLAKYTRGLLLFRSLHKVILIGRRCTFVSRKRITILGNRINIDSDVYIDAESHDGIVLGESVSVQRDVVIICSGGLQKMGKGLNIGDFVGIGRASFLGAAGGITIGENTILGNMVSMHSENHIFESKDTPIRLQGVSRKGINIGKDCWIGAKATILDGANVGDGCVIAAGAVVASGHYEAYSVLGGVPARVIAKRCPSVPGSKSLISSLKSGPLSTQENRLI